MDIDHNALQHCQQWFGETGSLSKYLEGYQPRQAQIEMAACLLQTISQETDIICEAGTGVGKTLAYLLPCLDSSKRTILATATKALQKQLYEKDIPLATQVFSGGIKNAVLKGKENYLSQSRLQRTWNDAHLLSIEEMEHLRAIQKWSESTTFGDRADCTDVPENSPIWKLVCTHPKDPIENDDYYAKARTKARGADLLIINQHLLCAELSLHQQSPTGSLLSEFNYIIIDEAHQFRDVATMSFGQQITRARLLESLEQGFHAITENALAFKDELRPLLTEINTHIDTLMRFFLKFQAGRYTWQSFYQHTDISWLDSLIAILIKTIQHFNQHKGEALLSATLEFKSLHDFFCLMKAFSQDNTDEQAIENQMCWLELFDDGRFSLYLTPIQVDNLLADIRMKTPLNWIYTSATLTVANDFSHFKKTLGLDEKTPAKSYASPFDFHKQVAWYQNNSLPPTNSKEYIPAYIEALLPICRLCEGRSFLLFCSYVAMYQAEKILRQYDEFNLFVQGSKHPHKLLQEFKASSQALLLGTKSFWEGVDVRGQQLSFVCIDKLPFASPGEPLNQAREKWYKDRGQDSFKEYFLPQAVISLKQGFGRLIRDTQDYGILMIGDNRLWQRAYGKQFIASLPPYQTFEQLADINTFWQKHQTVKTPTQ